MNSKSSESHSPPRSAASNETRLTHPRSLVELAYDQLLSMLVTMKIKPGERIGIESLARQMGISQTPIREALTMLEAQRLACKIPNVGFRAASLLSPTEVDALFELRLMLEPTAAALAAQRASPQDLQKLTELAADMTLVAQGTDVAYTQFADGDAKLHHLIAVASGNGFLAEVVRGMHVHIHIFRHLYKSNAPQRAVDEHDVLIAALLARNPIKAEQAMRAHLLASHQRMERVTEEREALTEATVLGKSRTARGRARKS